MDAIDGKSLRKSRICCDHVMYCANVEAGPPKEATNCLLPGFLVLRHIFFPPHFGRTGNVGGGGGSDIGIGRKRHTYP